MPVGDMQVLEVLSQSGVLASLKPNETFRLLDSDISALESAVLYLAISSELRIVAVLKGAVSATGLSDSIAAGEAAIWPLDGDRPLSSAFDIDRFLASSSLALPQTVRDTLQEVAKAQREALFWGVLERTASNAQSPFPPAEEAVRRDMLLRPDILELRSQAAGDAAVLSRLVADRFMEGLRRRDVQAVRDLLAPKLFSPDRRAPSAWLAVRHDFAEALIASPLGQALAGGRLATSEASGAFTIVTAERRYSMQIVQEVGMMFVGEIAEETER